MQIKLNKPLSQLNNIILRNNLQPTPRRSHTNQLNARTHKENQPLINNMNRSPHRSNSKKVLNSKDDSMQSIGHNQARGRAKSRKSMVPVVRKCQNHDDIEGQYHINIEGQDLYYCDKCALKLKNQGFPVKKQEIKSGNTTRDSRQHCGNRLLNNYSHLDGHPQFEILKKLLTQIYQAEQKMKRSQKVQQFQQLIQLKQRQNERRDSLIFCRTSQKPKEKKAGKIQNNFKDNESLEEIQMMKGDIEGNVECIVDEVQDKTFRQCVESYKERIQILNIATIERANEVEKIRINLDNFLEQAIFDMQAQLRKIQSKISDSSQQKVITSEGLESLTYLCDDTINRGPFRNLFHGDRDKSKKRLISKK